MTSMAQLQHAFKGSCHISMITVQQMAVKEFLNHLLVLLRSNLAAWLNTASADTDNFNKYFKYCHKKVKRHMGFAALVNRKLARAK